MEFPPSDSYGNGDPFPGVQLEPPPNADPGVCARMLWLLTGVTGPVEPSTGKGGGVSVLGI